MDSFKKNGIELDRHPDSSIDPRQTYLYQSIINFIGGMGKSNSNPTPVVKPPL